MVSHNEKKLRKKNRVSHKPPKRRKNKSLPTIIGIGVVFAIIVAFFITQIEPPISTEGLPPFTLTQPHEFDNTQGDGPIFFIKYSDFQCPACASFSPLLKQMMDDYGEHITFAYRHFPLKQQFANSVQAARASEAAARQDAFWEYHDTLFAQQREWANVGNPTPFFVRYATELGLDEAQFRADLADPEIAAIVEHSYQHAISQGMSGTPSLYLNGRPLQGISSYEDLALRIERELR
ncbi:MAG: DsbA family protein [Candidatus Woesearchaeota archaeon]